MIQIDMQMPDCCSECRFKTGRGFCKAMPDNFCGYIIDYERPEWCPLKEQEPVKPEVYYVGPDKYRFYRCPVCKTAWYYKGKYCLECGRKVKWDG